MGQQLSSQYPDGADSTSTNHQEKGDNLSIYTDREFLCLPYGQEREMCSSCRYGQAKQKSSEPRRLFAPSGPARGKGQKEQTIIFISWKTTESSRLLAGNRDHLAHKRCVDRQQIGSSTRQFSSQNKRRRTTRLGRELKEAHASLSTFWVGESYSRTHRMLRRLSHDHLLRLSYRLTLPVVVRTQLHHKILCWRRKPCG